MIIIKIGGTKGVNYERLLDEVSQLEIPMIIVHGCSGTLNDLQEAMGHPPTFVTSISGFQSRYTDAKTLELFLMACGLIRTRLVAWLQQLGRASIGLTGADGKILTCIRKNVLKIMVNGKKKILRGDYSGKIDHVNTSLLQMLLDEGIIPVLSPIGLTNEGILVNLDADRVAAAIAGSLHASDLVIFSNVPGIMDLDYGKLFSSLTSDQARMLARGRMKTKVLAAREALDHGVKRVIIASANIESPLTSALSGENGTVMTK